MNPPFITSSLDFSGISHGFFTREGGVSTDAYSSLNVGYGSGDDQEKVKENRRRVAAALNSAHDDIVTVYQIHSNVVQVIQDVTDVAQEADALVTATPGMAIAVLTADCVPVLFADPHASVIGAAHAGWKGAKAGILENTVHAMAELGASAKHITAAIGPAIQQDSYEVTSAFKTSFTEDDASAIQFFKPGKDADHWQFDLPGMVANTLDALGIANIEKLDYDTYTDEQRFYSFRRATHRNESDYGRQCSAIILG